ncbi:hypothetical protein SAMD00019534_090990 [Acytostelium subglobosum LB1]|uniref:hypothetical protein n=1 Tax=Acytostelium subglobosum LB1 TaxID=1410327 RepID=UPI000644823C|nr:hypothetical protein SAMD00019534_090990 [Acytostelium subglobosum LB1]GAM25924.1 hypothetical protein SAMD00019534_090990 [Acytostelium subglobosum LB1]|eukprot:XP_012750967.1 hypothetical protein SAMD00019534_090990 [Acytostelium subglobosum LB1]
MAGDLHTLVKTLPTLFQIANPIPNPTPSKVAQSLTKPSTGLSHPTKDENTDSSGQAFSGKVKNVAILRHVSAENFELQNDFKDLLDKELKLQRQGWIFSSSTITTNVYHVKHVQEIKNSHPDLVILLCFTATSRMDSSSLADIYKLLKKSLKCPITTVVIRNGRLFNEAKIANDNDFVEIKSHSVSYEGCLQPTPMTLSTIKELVALLTK